MADFVAVLRKTLDGLGETTPAMRERVYEKARATVSAKLAAINHRRRQALPTARSARWKRRSPRSKREYAAPSDPLSELEDVSASLKNPQPKVLAQPTVKTGAWPKTTPAAASTARPANGAARSAPPPLPVQLRARPLNPGSGRSRRFHRAADGRGAQAQLRPFACGGPGACGPGGRRLRHLAEQGRLRRPLRARHAGCSRYFSGGGGGPSPMPRRLPATDTPAAAAPGEEPKLTQRLTPEGDGPTRDPPAARQGGRRNLGRRVDAAPGARRRFGAQPGGKHRMPGAWPSRRARGAADGAATNAPQRRPMPRLPSPRKRFSTKNARALPKARPSPAPPSGRWSRNRPAAICRRNPRSAPKRPFPARM